MTKMEKQMVGGIVVAVLLMAFLVSSISRQINDAGGMRAIIVEAGKEVKSISKEITEEK